MMLVSETSAWERYRQAVRFLFTTAYYVSTHRSGHMDSHTRATVLRQASQAHHLSRPLRFLEV